MKSKTLTTWLAVIGGGLGLHRFYLHGWKDWFGWLHLLTLLLGLVGLMRVQSLGQDDQVAWMLLPLGGLSLSAAMLTAIVHGLTPDERWDARHNAGLGPSRPAGWGAVIGVAAALLLGATALMSTIAFSLQRYFETEMTTTKVEQR